MMIVQITPISDRVVQVELMDKLSNEIVRQEIVHEKDASKIAESWLTEAGNFSISLE